MARIRLFWTTGAGTMTVILSNSDKHNAAMVAVPRDLAFNRNPGDAATTPLIFFRTSIFRWTEHSICAMIVLT
jgi:hypothetical protein